MEKQLDLLIGRVPELAGLRADLRRAAEMLVAAAGSDRRIMTAGNGGSFADAEHITGELLKGFCKKRPLPEEWRGKFRELWGEEEGMKLAGQLQMGIPAVNLALAPALMTAFGNDVAPELSYAQHLWAVGRPGDVLIAISTGGNAENIRLALMAAKVRGVSTILLTGAKHGACERYADVSLRAPETETYKIQEYHLPIYHTLCLIVEEALFRE